MIDRRTWQRRHTNGLISEVTSVPGVGSWAACVQVAGTNRHEQIRKYFSLLVEAQEVADRLAQVLLPHDCSECQAWRMVERRQSKRRR
jgi:hypothetical protein